MSTQIHQPAPIGHLDLRGAKMAKLHWVRHIDRQLGKNRRVHPSILDRVDALSAFIKEKELAKQVDDRLERGWGRTW